MFLLCDRKVRRKKLCHVHDFVGNEDFWQQLPQFLRVVIPTIKSLLLLQSASCTLDDVLYAFGRNVQTPHQNDEKAVLKKPCSRFEQVEFPLLFMCCFHPKYREIGIKIVEHNIVTLCDVVSFVSGLRRVGSCYTVIQHQQLWNGWH